MRILPSTLWWVGLDKRLSQPGPDSVKSVTSWSAYGLMGRSIGFIAEYRQKTDVLRPILNWDGDFGLTLDLPSFRGGHDHAPVRARLCCRPCQLARSGR